MLGFQKNRNFKKLWPRKYNFVNSKYEQVNLMILNYLSLKSDIWLKWYAPLLLHLRDLVPCLAATANHISRTKGADVIVHNKKMEQSRILQFER